MILIKTKLALKMSLIVIILQMKVTFYQMKQKTLTSNTYDVHFSIDLWF